SLDVLPLPEDALHLMVFQQLPIRLTACARVAAKCGRDMPGWIRLPRLGVWQRPQDRAACVVLAVGARAGDLVGALCRALRAFRVVHRAPRSLPGEEDEGRDDSDGNQDPCPGHNSSRSGSNRHGLTSRRAWHRRLAARLTIRYPSRVSFAMVGVSSQLTCRFLT